MADDTQSGSWLSRTFNSFAKHLFSPTMLIMMAAMVLPAVAVAAPAGAATLGDLALGTVDMYWEMIKAPFTDGGVIFDGISNAFNGDILPQNYEMGMMDHGGHMEAAMTPTGSWLEGLSSEELAIVLEDAAAEGMTIFEYVETYTPY